MSLKLTLHNFKCFRETVFDLNQLTLLCGRNGAGKSSVLQSLLLAREVARRSNLPKSIPLNGLYGMDLGRTFDMMCHDANDEQIIIAIQSAGLETFICKFILGDDKMEDSFLTLSSANGNPQPFLTADNDFSFIYLGAERDGPHNWQEIQSEPVAQMGLGPRGEYVAEVLKHCERRLVEDALLHPLRARQTETPNRHLGVQLEYWLQDMFPNIQIRHEEVMEANVAYIRFRQNRLDAEWTRPAHSGFGLTYSLPILVAGLLVKPGSILIVENPEAHLHPQGQSQIAQFLARVAASGVYVVVETHSDHIINGTRLSCADREHPLQSDDVIIHYFDRDNEGAPSVEAIRVNSRGNLSKWPVGFFDQFERDLAEILKKRKDV